MLTITDMAIQRGGEQGFTVTLPALELGSGEVAALTGPSGCGKSTLLEMIGGILRPGHIGCYRLGEPPCDIGEALLADDEPLLADIRARELGFMLQHGGLLPWLSVEQNIALPGRLLGKTADSAWLEDITDRLGLRHLLGNMPSQLSIGERQRVAFARAIASQPHLLLADEPTAALDPHNAQILFGLIVEIVQSLNMVAVIVSHDWQRVADFNLKSYSATVTGAQSVFTQR